jgi:hypothetical protein
MMLRSLLLALLLSLPTLLAAHAPRPEPLDSRGYAPGLIENKGQLIDQHGQPRPDLLFSARSQGVRVFVSANGLHYQFSGGPKTPERLHRLDVTLQGANPNPTVHTSQPTGYHENYYGPRLPGGITGAKSYAQVRLKNVYPGIDWVLYRKGPYLKYDFVVEPGADPGQIRLQLAGAKAAHLTRDRGLRVSTPLGAIQEERPRSWQTDRHDFVATTFALQDRLLRFEVGKQYDPAEPLTIDPQLSWGSYFGGSSNERGYDLASAPNGDFYLAGWTNSSSNIATTGAHDVTYGANGNSDAFLAKFDSSGQRLWSTYYGGVAIDRGRAVAVGPGHSVYLGGYTSSNSAIATSGAHQASYGGGSEDAFLARFDSSGARQWGTYYGGFQAERCFALATAPNGDVYAGGRTNSSSNIASPGAHKATKGSGQQGFLARFDSNGTRQWGTYYGGSSSDNIRGIATTNSARVYIAGEANSSSGIATSGTHQSNSGGGVDAYLAQFNAAGSRLWGTYFGGANSDRGYGLAASGNGWLYLAGETASTGNIATSGAHKTSLGGSDDAFLARVDTFGQVTWATYYGGPSNEAGTRAVGADAQGNAFLVGSTVSGSGIATSGSYQTSPGGATDAFAAKFDLNGVRQWGSYYGGLGGDNARAVGIGPDGNVYLTGWTNSPGNIATPGAYQTSIGGNNDLFFAKFRGSPCQPTDSTFAVTACDSFTVPSNDSTYTTGGMIQDTIPNNAGCDSLLTINLTLNNSSDTTLNISACDSYTWPVNGQTYTSSATVEDTLTNNQQCDSVLTLKLTITPSPRDTQNVTACNSYTWPVTGQTFTTDTMVTDTIPASMGCDTIRTLALTLNNSPEDTLSVTACGSYSWPLTGETYTADTVVTDTVPAAMGCDTLRTLSLTVTPHPSATQTVSACDSFTWAANNETYTNGGIYTDTLPNPMGCDSIKTLDLSLGTTTTDTIDTVLNPGESISLGGTSYSQPGTYTDTLTGAANCDSIVTLILDVINSRPAGRQLQGLAIYPNPSQGRLQLEWRTGQLRSARLLTLQGQLRRSWAFEPGASSATLNLSELPSGAYLLRLAGPGGAARRRIVLE